MYATTKKSPGATRIVGLVMVVAINGLVAYAMANGIGTRIVAAITKTEVVVIEDVVELEEEPPPPPPPEVDLPPPPPQVVLPDFTFDVPPPPNAIRQVEQVAQPAPRPEVRPPPPPPPATPAVRPQVNARRFGEGMAEYYPSASRRSKEEGTVKVEMCVDDSGRISDLKVTGSSGHSRLDEATLKFLPRQRLTPAKDSAGKSIAWCNPPFPMDIVWQLE